MADTVYKETSATMIGQCALMAVAYKAEGFGYTAYVGSAGGECALFTVLTAMSGDRPRVVDSPNTVVFLSGKACTWSLF